MLNIKYFKMKKISTLLTIALIIMYSCKNESKGTISEKVEKQTINYVSFGTKISSDNAISKEEMAEIYSNLKEGDTIQVKFASKINEVCTKKGCWMNLDLNNTKEAFVKFKDYDFFVPLNASGREVIVRGKAFLKVSTVTELRHYAKDAGKTEEEIAEIVNDKHTLAFEADGVLMVK